ncbi:hypothetical protein O3P69_013688 [Scylla paramamosain]|uniref:Uncharacterized protein n=1 Tax=Scylla paramamosain TaxID=85552 RepID=A0AAW0SPB8_SCYPA
MDCLLYRHIASPLKHPGPQHTPRGALLGYSRSASSASFLELFQQVLTGKPSLAGAFLEAPCPWVYSRRRPYLRHHFPRESPKMKFAIVLSCLVLVAALAFRGPHKTCRGRGSRGRCLSPHDDD